MRIIRLKEVIDSTGLARLWALAVLTLYSSGSDPLALEVLIHPFQ